MKKIQNQDGFTIVELMIATTVLAVILLMVTVMMIGIGSLYYKGINEARVQDAVRTITDEVSQHLQETSSPPLVGDTTDLTVDKVPHAICIGTTRYTWISGVQIGKVANSVTYLHVLWRDTLAGGSNCAVAHLDASNPSSADGGTNGSELLTPNSQLTAFSLNPSLTSPYTLTVAIAYGDNGPTNNDTLLNLAGANTTCTGGAGQQFCATASLTTTVAQRL